MQPLVWLSRYILHPQKFNHVLNVSTLCFETNILLLQQKTVHSNTIVWPNRPSYHHSNIYENVHFKHFLYMMGFNLYPCVFNHHPQFSLLLTAFDTCWNNLTNNRLWLNWLTLSMLLILLYTSLHRDIDACLSSVSHPMYLCLQ